MSLVTVKRFHDFSAAHRDHLDAGKCGRIHGHNYRIHFVVAGPGGGIGPRGYAGGSFGDLKRLLCDWLEENWDHRLLLDVHDPAADPLAAIQSVGAEDAHPFIKGGFEETLLLMAESAVLLPFNPTTEAMAYYLLHVVGPKQLAGTDMTLLRVEIEETRKAGAAAMDISKINPVDPNVFFDGPEAGDLAGLDKASPEPATVFEIILIGPDGIIHRCQQSDYDMAKAQFDITADERDCLVRPMSCPNCFYADNAATRMTVIMRPLAEKQ